MSTPMDRLSSIFTLAKSKKVTEYKKAIKLLLEFWEDDSELAVQQISEYSKNPNERLDYYTWNDIYTLVHELFVAEIDRISKLGGSSGKLDKERVIKLLYLTTDKANYFLKPKSVVFSVIQILQSQGASIYAEFYEIYLSILRKYILQDRSQRILIQVSHWQELLNACIVILEKVILSVDYVKLLETIELIIRYGCSLSTLLFDARKLLPVLNNFLEKYETYNIKSTDILFKVTYTVCQQIATDSRYILCKFAENLPLSLINIKGPDDKYELYLLFIQVHHPNGEILGSEVSYTYDEDKWKAILNLFYKMVLNDIRPVKLSNKFISLAREVFRQKIFTKMPNSLPLSSFNESLYIQPRKKRRISDDPENIIDLVNDRDPERAWPMIQISTSLYKKYPDCLKDDEYIEFLDIIIKLMGQSCKFFLIMEDLCALAAVFVENERLYKSNNLSIHWNKVWDIVLRFLSMNHKEKLEKSFLLVQKLIIYEKVSSPNLLLKLYLSKSIQQTNLGVHTLNTFCEYNVLLNDFKECDTNLTSLTNNSIKLQLLKWTLNSLNNQLMSQLSIKKFSKTIIGFTLKSWYKSQSNDAENEYTNLEDCFFDDKKSVSIKDIESCYLSLKLKSNLPFGLNKTLVKPGNIEYETNVEIPYNVEDVEFLVNNLLQIVQTDDAIKDQCLFIIKTTLIARVISDLKAMRMIQCNFDEFSLVKELKICLNKIFDLVLEVNWSKSIRYTLEVTKSLTVLYQTEYDHLVNGIILNLTNFQILKKLYEVLKIEACDFDINSKISQSKINATVVLSSYCCINIGSELSDSQIKIISTLLKLKKYSLKIEADVVIVLTLLEIFANISKEMITDEFIELLMSFIENVFEEWQKDDKVVRLLLKLLPKFLDITTCSEDTNHIHNLLLICKLFHDRFSKGVFGQLTHLSLVQCLNSIVSHSAFYNSENKVLDHKVFITFVNSPYYYVRLESLRYIHSIFSIENIDYTWKINFFDELREVADRIFLLQRQLSDDEIREERVLRSTSSVQILLTVICSKSVFQSLALFTLIRIVNDKGIDSNTVKEILKLINSYYSSTNGIVEKNLNYLLVSWCEMKNLEAFPYSFLNCSSEAEFYDRYFEIIFPVLVRSGKIQDAHNFCSYVDVSFEDAFKKCCSSIIPWAISDEKILKQLQENQEGFEKIGSLATHIKDNLRMIVIELVQRLHDLNHFYTTFNETTTLPESDPPHLKLKTLDLCFDRLVNLVLGETKETIFYLMITRKPHIVQRTLLHLTSSIYSSKITEYKAKALHQYVYFCSKIIEELKQDYCDSVSTYFIKDIGCTLLNLIKEENPLITKLACKYLHTFLTNLLPKRSAEVSNILNLCVKTLTSLVSLSKNNTSTADQVLVFLLQEQREYLASAIENLGSLPIVFKTKNDVKSEILRENLEQFLQASDDKTCTIDCLLNLQHQLSSKKSQLEKIYEELELNQGFAEHCVASVLHRLIYRLICLTNSADAKISLQAAKCLGILGPANLTTLILHPQEIQKRESVDKADMLTYTIFKMLADFVTSDNIELKKASSDALYGILNSHWGARLGKDFEAEKDFEHLIKFLQPFKVSNKSNASRANLQIDVENFEIIFDEENVLWFEKSNDQYALWISEMTSAVSNCLNGFYCTNLLPIFKLNVRFCEASLPRIISLIIHTNSTFSKKICQCINRFFEYHFFNGGNVKVTSMNTAMVLQKHSARDAIRCMLNVVNHLRIQTKEQINLNLDYLPIAMAAQFCSAYFSSVLYTELWCKSNLLEERDFDSIPIIDQVYEQNNTLGKIAQDLLKEAYVKIGDSDSLRGCGSSHLQTRKSRIPYYSNFQKLDKLVLSHDVELSVRPSSPTGMIHALKDLSLHYLANSFCSATAMQVDSMEDLCYDSLWRLSDWNQIIKSRASNPSKKSNNFSTSHYEALKCLHENDKGSLKNQLEKAYFCIIEDLRDISLESCKAVYPQLSQLQMLREIEEFSSAKVEDYKTVLSNWEKQNYVCNNNFQYVEPVLTQRAVMFGIQDPIKKNHIIKNALINVQIQIAELGREQGHLNVAARALETVTKLTDLSEENEDFLLFHEAHLAWKRKDEDMARFNLRSLIKKNSINRSLLARTLRIYGNLIAENKSENPQAIIDKYYKRAVDTYLEMENLKADDIKDGCKARATLAQFAHEQYLVITDYMKSPQFESLKECIIYSKNTLMKNKNVDNDTKRFITITTRQSENDNLELNNIRKDRDKYLLLAVENYMDTLRDSDDHDLLIFRLVSLWLDNMYDEGVNELLNSQLQDIPSYKFIALVPQLAPHMSNVEDVFTKKISHLLERCAQEHPHHSLPILLSLKNLYNDSKHCGKKVTNLEPRVLGAQQLIQKLLSTNIRPIVQEMDMLSDALVSLAYFGLDKKKAPSISTNSIPRSEGLSTIKGFQHSMIPTINISMKKNGNYSNIISVSKYESNYSNVGGINAPKKVICIGTDGIRRPQLVKGKDDLRQDAVMQQVFTVMNSLLKTNKDAKQRKLYVRTYKVVPLTQRSGVLEWCENTLPLSCILTGDGTKNNPGLHKKYYPNDYAPMDCRKRLSTCKTQQKFSIYMDCCKNLHPAFHYFFTENYLSPETWFERRLAYTRSVATTSIIGYILGLGDRHVSNILIDKSTAEVIHIDFGIAFEQGKVLPTPETVPFRLTRDIEIAMGVSGVEGTMRRSCEETMAVLREQKEIIVTLLRVLLYDPLYSWAITPAKAATYQSGHSTNEKETSSPTEVTETNKLAERALVRVQQKLQGIEEGVASSIPGQVERLIQQARDPVNLCQLFVGWQAYL